MAVEQADPVSMRKSTSSSGLGLFGLLSRHEKVTVRRTQGSTGSMTAGSSEATAPAPKHNPLGRLTGLLPTSAMGCHPSLVYE